MKVIYEFEPQLLTQLHALYLGEWWTKQRSLAETESCVALAHWRRPQSLFSDIETSSIAAESASRIFKGRDPKDFNQLVPGGE